MSGWTVSTDVSRGHLQTAKATRAVVVAERGRVDDGPEADDASIRLMVEQRFIISS